MSVTLFYVRKANVGVNTTLEFWGCTKSPRYHSYRFYTNRYWPDKMYPYVEECSKH